MIITRQELLTIASDDLGVLERVYSDPTGVISTLKENGNLEIFTFYNRLRKNYNEKHSKVYINIMKEVEDPKKVLTTLSALVTQILLFSEKSKYKNIFIRHSKLNEILKALEQYSESQTLIPCVEIIKELKQDIKQIEAF